MHPHDMRSTQYGGDDRRRVGGLQRRRGLCPRRLNEWPDSPPAGRRRGDSRPSPAATACTNDFRELPTRMGSPKLPKAFEVREDFVILAAGFSEA